MVVFTSTREVIEAFQVGLISEAEARKILAVADGIETVSIADKFQAEQTSAS